MGKNLTLGELTAKPGEKISGWLHIADSGLEIVSITTVPYFLCGIMDLFPGAMRVLSCPIF